MNSPNVQDKIKAVMVRILEDAAFLFSDELAPGPEDTAAGWNAIGGAIKFSGERTGAFRLWTDPSLCPILTSNMLGIDPGFEEDAEKKNMDALRETVNMIAGNLMTELFGTQAVTELGLPEAADPALKEADFRRNDAVWLSAEGKKILGVIDIDEK